MPKKKPPAPRRGVQATCMIDTKDSKHDGTLCWNCNAAYAMKMRQCPDCCSTNANKDFANAQEEMQDKNLIDHDWQWIKDWYGDPNVVNGTVDCSHWRCKRCESEECEDAPPPKYDRGSIYDNEESLEYFNRFIAGDR